MPARRVGGITVRSMLMMTAIIMSFFLIMQPLSIWQFYDKIVLLFPKGQIAVEQRNLLFIVQAIMLLVIIPVYIFTFIFSWKFRASNPKGKYDPDLIDNYLLECFWWGIPLVLTILISILTWIRTYELDPYRPIVSDKKPITIEVVALQWKWLFIYPEEKIASLNFIQFPKDTPLHFKITADAPMNSFWIPALGGQIYAMPAMQTELFLIANQLGDSRGSSANISGVGFADMNFIARSSSEEDYKNWVASIKQSKKVLDKTTYNALVAPSQKDPQQTFQLREEGLFDQIMMKYMEPPK